MRRKDRLLHADRQTFAVFICRERNIQSFYIIFVRKEKERKLPICTGMIELENFNFDISLIFAVLNGRVSAAINRKLAGDLKANGIQITPEQMTVLSLLWKKDNVSQQELCNATFKDKPNMTRLIDSLETKGYVVRISDKRDRRNNLINLTAKGREIEEKAFDVANQTLRKALSNATIEELKDGQNLLKKIFSNMRE